MPYLIYCKHLTPMLTLRYKESEYWNYYVCLTVVDIHQMERLEANIKSTKRNKRGNNFVETPFRKVFPAVCRPMRSNRNGLLSCCTIKETFSGKQLRSCSTPGYDFLGIFYVYLRWESRPKTLECCQRFFAECKCMVRQQVSISGIIFYAIMFPR